MVEKETAISEKLKHPNYIGLSYQFLHLSREAIKEMELQGNRTTIISKADGESNNWEKYEELTRWNDFNIGVPILFNFYHGLELMLKGLILECGENLEAKDHKLSNLLGKLKSSESPPSDGVIQIFDKYVNQGPFIEFFNSNDSNIDNFYQLLKYPESMKNEQFRFYEIRGTEKKGLTRFKEIRQDIQRLREEIIKWNLTRHA
jgi:hypothetical protein